MLSFGLYYNFLYMLVIDDIFINLVGSGLYEILRKVNTEKDKQFKEALKKTCNEFLERKIYPLDESFYNFFSDNKECYEELKKIIWVYSENINENIKKGLLEVIEFNWPASETGSKEVFIDSFLNELRNNLNGIPEFHAHFVQCENYFNNKKDSHKIDEILKRMSKVGIDPATTVEKSYKDYKKFLKKELIEDLSQLGGLDTYVKLRSYRRIEKYSQRFAGYGQTQKFERKVFYVEDELKKWMIDFTDKNKDNPIQIISGGPGYGKSFLLKKLALDFIDQDKVDIYFIPFKDIYDIHEHLEVKLSFIVFHFLKRRYNFQVNPLDERNTSIILLFDGLDELAMYQGSTSAEIAGKFIKDLKNSLNDFNAQNFHIKAIVSGRTPEIEDIAGTILNLTRNISYLLPLWICSKEINQEIELYDDRELLWIDQRELWWNKFLAQEKAKVIDKSSINKLLSSEEIHIRELTSIPLLNKFIAEMILSGLLHVDELSSLNKFDLYNRIVNGIYDYNRNEKEHPSLNNIKNKNEFDFFLHQLAQIAWQTGGGRMVSNKSLRSFCDYNSGFKKILEYNSDDTQAKKFCLNYLRLAAFYFDRRDASLIEGSFEFTHRSFSEFLMSRQILSLMNELAAENDATEPGMLKWLQKWILLTGPQPVNDNIKNFLIEALNFRLQNKKNLSEIHQIHKKICSYLSYAAAKEMPMEMLRDNYISPFKPLNFSNELQWAANSELALFIAVNACAISLAPYDEKGFEIKYLTGINWKDRETFKIRFQRLIGLFNYESQNFFRNSLSFLQLRNIDLQGANFQDVNLRGADFLGADLEKANFQGADLQGADFLGADLQYANFQGANLRGADLRGADLKGAHLRGADLKGVDLRVAVNFKLPIHMDQIIYDKDTLFTKDQVAGTVLEDKVTIKELHE